VLADPAQAGQIVAFYQPKSALSSGRICGVEALVRWQHPSKGLIPPVDFVPVVETTDLVRPLTLRMLDQALTELARWSSLDLALTVAVNLSARSLHDRDLVDDVSGLLRRHHVDPRLLTLEITESAVMEDPGEAKHVLDGLSGLGVSLSVDDFGTGYSSLSYLAQLPVDEVKVDRSFVSRITTDERAAAIVRSVVDLGHSLNLSVVAEGVEDQHCWDALIEVGCDVAQGYLLSKPLPRDQFETWLSAHAHSFSAH
jgi:EAL domain-containing protein (putative c-di-GMP-specific phosphodiesterase class I)